MRVITALDALGRQATAGRIAVVARVNIGQVRAELEALESRGVVRFTDGRPVVDAAASLPRMSAPESREVHGRVAAVLHRDGLAVDVVADHLLRTDGNGSDWAVDVLVEAASQAHDRGEAGRAQRLLERAAREDTTHRRMDIVTGLAEVTVSFGYREGRRRLLELRDHLPDPRDRGRLTALAAMATFNDPVSGVAEVIDEMEALSTPLPDLVAFLLAGAMSNPIFNGRQDPELESRARRLLPTLTPGIGSGALLATLGMLQVWRGRGRVDAIADLHRALDEIVLDGRLQTVRWARTPIFCALLGLVEAGEQPSRVAARIVEVESRLPGNRDPRLAAMVRFVRARLALESARPLIVLERAEPLQRWFEATDIPGGTAEYLAGIVATAQLLVEDTAGAIETLAPLDSMGRRLAPSWGWFDRAMLEARRRGRRFNPVRVAAAWEDVGDQLAAAGGANPVLVPWRVRAGDLLRNVDALRARDLVDEHLAVARAWGDPVGIAEGLVVVADLAGGGDTRALLHEVLDLLGGASAGERGVGVRIRAMQRMAVVDPDGDWPARTRVLARRHALPQVNIPSPESRVDVASLTGREREVVVLAATGASSAAIATALDIASRTVDTHLGRAYRKLGVAGRDELPAVVASAPSLEVATLPSVQRDHRAVT